MYVDQTGQLGGGELSLLDVVRHSCHLSEVALFSDGPFRDALESLPVPVHLLTSGAIRDVRSDAGIHSVLAALPAYAALRNRLATVSEGFDVLYANSQKAFLIAALARHRNQALVWHLRDMLTAEHFSPLMRKIAILAGNHAASVIIGNSKATVQSFEQAGGRPGKTIVIYNGISPQPFDQVNALETKALRLELGLQGKPLVGLFGRLAEWKGQHILLEALAMLPHIHGLIVGEALFGEDAYSETLRKRSQQDDLRGRVHMLGFRKNVPALMKMVDIVVHTSTAPEPFGRVLVEGMLAGKPVIATGAGGAIEIIDDGVNGLLTTPQNSKELVRAITRLQSDPAFATQIAEAGRRKAVELFSVDAMVRSIDRVIGTFKG
jgi:glycosyltransferase involved in cell wall biosynthesis